MSTPSICFVGLENLPALAPEYGNFHMGGAQLQQTLLAKNLVALGWNVSMIVGDYGQPDGKDWFGIRTLRAYGQSDGLPMLRFLYPRWTSVWAAMQRAQAQVYYVSCAGMLIGEVAAYAQRHRKAAAFRIAHDTDCEPDKLLISYRRDKWLYEYGLRRAAIILAQSRGQQSLMRTHYGLETVVVPSLVEVADESRPHAERNIAALWISNIRPFKRPDLALDLARSNSAVSLTMIGGTQPGAESYYAEIKRQASQLPNVKFLGHQRNEAVNQMLGATCVFVNTSDSEGFPNTYLQAWARGTPVVAFFDPDGVVAREGLGYAVRSIAEMRAAVVELLTNPARWTEMSNRCQRYVAERHGKSAVGTYAQALQAIAVRPNY